MIFKNLMHRSMYGRSLIIIHVMVNGIALDGKPTTELLSIICHMGSLSFTCHSPQVNAPHHTSSQTGQHLI